MIARYPIKKVKCPGCGKIYYQTNAKFDPHKPLRGYMIDLLKMYQKKDWAKFSEGEMGDNVPPSQMLCIGCGYPLAKNGKLILVDELTCPVCGKKCKTRLGLSSHMRIHRGEV